MQLMFIAFNDCKTRVFLLFIWFSDQITLCIFTLLETVDNATGMGTGLTWEPVKYRRVKTDGCVDES